MALTQLAAQGSLNFGSVSKIKTVTSCPWPRSSIATAQAMHPASE